MVEHFGYFDLVNEGFFSIFLRKSRFLSKGLDGHLPLVAQTDSQINSGKITLAKALLCLKEIVKVELIH